MNWADLDNFSFYEKQIPCPFCDKMATPTVAGGHWKCHSDNHVFNEDGSALEIPCNCQRCNPQHDPLVGKTKGKKAELQLPERKPKKIRRPRATRKNTRSGS